MLKETNNRDKCRPTRKLHINVSIKSVRRKIYARPTGEIASTCLFRMNVCGIAVCYGSCYAFLRNSLGFYSGSYSAFPITEEETRGKQKKKWRLQGGDRSPMICWDINSWKLSVHPTQVLLQETIYVRQPSLCCTVVAGSGHSDCQLLAYYVENMLESSDTVHVVNIQSCIWQLKLLKAFALRCCVKLTIFTNNWSY